MHNLPALSAPEVPIIVYFQLFPSLVVLLPRELQAPHDPLHVRLVPPAQEYLKPVVEIVLILGFVVLKHSALKPAFRPVPHLPLGFLLDLHADQLVRVYPVFCEFP